ncbi:MAG: ribose transport system permease protein [Kosmotogales bacterium]|nr:ribose transport system permease protein [Kosmotogales bacterium]
MSSLKNNVLTDENKISKKIADLLVNGSIVIGFIGVIIVFAIKNSSFLSIDNISDILMRVSITAPAAFGVMLALIVKGIDLTPGTTMGLVGLTITGGITAGLSFGVSLVLSLLVGALVGICTALLISKANLNPFIATIAILFIGNSIEKGVTQGGLPIYIYPSPKPLNAIYRGTILGIPNPIIILIIITLVLYVFLDKSEYGRKMYACGESIKASRASGIPVRFYFGMAYFLAAICACVGGIILCSQIRSGQPLVGHSYMWDAIGAAYLSTIMSRRNFRPNVFGTLFGTLVMATVANGFTLMGIPFYWKEFAKGLIILVILMVSVMKKRYERRKTF